MVELNRAVAVGMAFGPGQALELVDTLAEEPAVSRYRLLSAVQADLLAKVGRSGPAIEAYERAAALAQNERDRAMLARCAHLVKGSAANDR